MQGGSPISQLPCVLDGGLLGARWMLLEVVVFSGTSRWNVHFQCRGGSSFKILRGLSLPNISRQEGVARFIPYIKAMEILNF